MSVGLIFFTLADSTVQPTFSLYGKFVTIIHNLQLFFTLSFVMKTDLSLTVNVVGVTLISLALCADAVIGNVQEKTMKQFQASNSEMVSY